MKKNINTILLLLYSLLVGATIISCGNDDDDSFYLTYAQQTQALESLNGEYIGYLYFCSDNKKDSVEISWTVDSEENKFTFSSFPISILGNYISTNLDVKNALIHSNNQELYGIVSSDKEAKTSYWNNNFYFYTMSPSNNSLSFYYNGEKCDIIFADMIQDSSKKVYSKIQYHNNESNLNLLIKSIKVGGKEVLVNKVLNAVGRKVKGNMLTLTYSQRVKTLQSLAGDYSGYLYFYNGTKKDSVEVDWMVSASDSTFTSFSFPISFLRNYVSTNSTVKDAVTNAGRQTLIGAVNTYSQASTTYWEQHYYFYLMTPANKTLKFNYNGKACEITFADYMANSSYGYLYPQIQYYNKKSSINFVVKSVKVGDDQVDVSTVFQAVGSK